MLLARLLLRRFFVYLLSVGGFLVFIHRFIDATEKLARVQNASMFYTLGNFILLTCIPAWFELVPLTSWLALCLLLREWSEQHTLDTLLVIGVSRVRITALIAAAGLLSSMVYFVGTHYLVPQLQNITRELRGQLDPSNNHTYELQWVRLTDGSFVCRDITRAQHATSSQDIATYTNTSSHPLLIITCDMQGYPVSITHGNTTGSHAETGWCYDVQRNTVKSIPPSLRNTTHSDAHHDTPHALHRGLDSQILRHTLAMLNTVLQPLVLVATAGALWLAPIMSTLIRWLCVLGLYPLLVCTHHIVHLLVATGWPSFLIAIPNLLCLGIMSACVMRRQRNRR